MIKFRRYPGYSYGAEKVMLPWYYLRVGPLHVEFHRSNENYHGPDKEPVQRGWRVINLKQANGNHGTGKSLRLIKYLGGGKWCYLDINWNRKRDF